MGFTNLTPPRSGWRCVSLLLHPHIPHQLYIWDLATSIFGNAAQVFLSLTLGETPNLSFWGSSSFSLRTDRDEVVSNDLWFGRTSWSEAVLLAVGHHAHAPVWFAALDLIDHVRQILRFLRQLAVGPLQELEVFHRTTLFPLRTESATLKQTDQRWKIQTWSGQLTHWVGCWWFTLTWRIIMLRLMKAGEVSVLLTSTSKSPKVFLSASQ